MNTQMKLLRLFVLLFALLTTLAQQPLLAAGSKALRAKLAKNDKKLNIAKKEMAKHSSHKSLYNADSDEYDDSSTEKTYSSRSSHSSSEDSDDDADEDGSVKVSSRGHKTTRYARVHTTVDEDDDDDTADAPLRTEKKSTRKAEKQTAKEARKAARRKRQYIIGGAAAGVGALAILGTGLGVGLTQQDQDQAQAKLEAEQAALAASLATTNTLAATTAGTVNNATTGLASKASTTTVQDLTKRANASLTALGTYNSTTGTLSAGTPGATNNGLMQQVGSLSTAVAGKADTATVNTALGRKADTSALTTVSGVASRADSALGTYNATTGTYSGGLTGSVAGKADATALAGYVTTNAANSTYATQSALGTVSGVASRADVALGTYNATTGTYSGGLTGSVSGKANASDVYAKAEADNTFSTRVFTGEGITIDPRNSATTNSLAYKATSNQTQLDSLRRDVGVETDAKSTSGSLYARARALSENKANAADVYSRTDADTTFATRGNVYSRTESDGRYTPAGYSYSREDSDGRYTSVTSTP